DKPRDRRVVGPPLSRQYTERDIFFAGPLDHTRGPGPARARVEQQRHHNGRFIRRPATPVRTVGDIERLQIHLLDDVDHEPREVPLRQPLANIRRHQERLLSITRDQALAHHPIVLNASDGTSTYATASLQGGSGPTRINSLWCVSKTRKLAASSVTTY